MHAYAQVSCGPYHTAAVTCGGELFTWGSSVFGQLGHGSAVTAFTPRRVDALAGCLVVQVWASVHTLRASCCFDVCGQGKGKGKGEGLAGGWRCMGRVRRVWDDRASGIG
eukprot:352795-Chlamydomonas_euryale.AAC.2